MKRVYATVLLVSASALVFEISLTRIFSIYLSYHFAFMIISIAMLGIGSAGTVLAFNVDRVVTKERFTDIDMPRYALFAGVAIISSYVVTNHIPFDPAKLSWEPAQVLYFCMYSIVLSIPFLFSGLLIASAFLIYSGISERIYFADLGGAGAGALCVVLLLTVSGPEDAVIIASVICLLAAFVSGRGWVRYAVILLLLVNVWLYQDKPDAIKVRISPFKPLSLALRYPGSEHLKTFNSIHGRIDMLKSPATRFAPGLSLTYLEPLPEQIGLSIDGGEMSAITKGDPLEKLRFLEHMPSSLAYYLRPGGRVLVLEPRGGLQVLMASHFGSRRIYKVDSNPLIFSIIESDLAGFSEGIYKENAFPGYGRTWLKRSQNPSFDIIDLPLLGTSVTSMFGVSEDYRFTVEAFKEYLASLSSKGVLSVSFYIVPPPRREFRLLTTIVEALEESGTQDVSHHIIALRSWDSMTLITKKTAFSSEEIVKLKDFSRRNSFDLIHYPGISEGESNVHIRSDFNEYYKGYQKLLAESERAAFMSGYLFDIAPVRDENPFFHYYLKVENIKAIYDAMGGKYLFFLEQGYILPLILIIAISLSLIMIFLPIYLSAARKKICIHVKRGVLLGTIMYFASLGVGFMFVEVTLIQKTILVLESPVYAVTLVLTVILVSSGLGSMLSGRISAIGSTPILLLLSFLIWTYSVAYPVIIDWITPYSFAARIVLTGITLFPVGFLMGVPFPLGMKRLGYHSPSLIPVAWAVNACFSVVAPVISEMLALYGGFRIVLWTASLLYLSSFIALSFLPGRSWEQRRLCPSA